MFGLTEGDLYIYGHTYHFLYLYINQHTRRSRFVSLSLSLSLSRALSPFCAALYAGLEPVSRKDRNPSCNVRVNNTPRPWAIFNSDIVLTPHVHTCPWTTTNAILRRRLSDIPVGFP